MHKCKYYYRTKFPPRAIEEADGVLIQWLPADHTPISPQDLSVWIGMEWWKFDSREEFLTEYLQAPKYRFDHILLSIGGRLFIDGNTDYASILVEANSRARIEGVFAIFERYLPESIISVPEEPLQVFIGHGRNSQWRDLKDHLQDQHGIKVIAYETGPRAGLSVKEVLEKLVTKASFALLVLTGEDLHADGELHARENVIHELGLFQGQLGFTRAIAVLEEDVREFSNILGVNQIRFAKGRIRETFGDVLATIRREFSSEGQ